MPEPRPERVDDERFIKTVRDLLEDDPDLTPEQVKALAKRRLEHQPDRNYRTGGF